MVDIYTNFFTSGNYNIKTIISVYVILFISINRNDHFKILVIFLFDFFKK